ncbi:MAG: insulinase family protein [Flavobacteriaceae bacterium]|nr:insulinase family protein [Flavobacteriaceae bacterium]
MKKSIFLLFCVLVTSIIMAQKVSFVEFDLDNGLHVILHQDNAAPVVTTAVMYHVGAKDENPNRTGFAHFFEHLLFEGTKNIERGKWFEIVSSNGGTNNANTNNDRTYYYEVFPSNNLELGLWMESERMLHPIINQIGVDTQNEVVKEEKRLRIDNQPYGNILAQIKKNMFVKHPYRWATIGSMDHLDAATLEEFQAFNEKFYIPNNAVLVVAGDINIAATKKMINKYFSEIPKGTPIKRASFKEDAIVKEFTAEYRDSNIQIPMLLNAYRTPSMKTREARILDMISTILSDGKSSRLFKKMVEQKKNSLNVGAVNFTQEDYGMYILYALPLGETTLDTLQKEIDEEIVKIQTELISEKEMEKLKNKFLNQFVNSNSSVEGIAHSLASFYMLYGNVNLINTELDIYNSITREEIRTVAKKYLNNNQRMILNYLPKEEKNK